MSVFGGDSWAGEAQHRKRRIEDLMLPSSSSSSSSSSYKQLSNGKYACLICPNNPVLDSPLMLSMHGKGSRHIAAESRLKERELMKQEELKKRIALSNESTDCEGLSLSTRQFKSSSKPLIERTRKAAFETLHHRTHEQNDVNYCYDIKSKQHPYFFSPKSQPASKERLELSRSVKPESGKSDERNNTSRPSGEAGKMLAEQMMELQNRREKELKFTAAGWKRDCHGKWFRDENVEFDSDEEDPNVCLS
ncbi:hypothetical protein AAC387_Pa04g2815 [Persea americana]